MHQARLGEGVLNLAEAGTRDVERGGAEVGAVEDVEDLEEKPLKGLFCRATWGDPDEEAAEEEDADSKKKKKKKKKRRVLRSLSFETINVEGKIQSIEGETIVLKVRPTGGQEWPDIEARRSRSPKKPGNKPKKVARRKIRLKLLEELTEFEAGNSAPLDLGDFEVDQRIEAIVACGTKAGMMVKLRAPGVEGDEGAGRGEDDGGGDRRPRGGRPGRGGGGGRPGGGGG